MDLSDSLQDDRTALGRYIVKRRCGRAVDQLFTHHCVRAFAQRRQTVAETIRMLRLLRASEMLAVPPYSIPIETIAYRCGFEEVRTFNRCFSKVFGMSAGRYRQARVDESLKVLHELADP